MDEKDENCECEDFNAEDAAYNANAKVDALIELLIKKEIITEKEINDEYESLFSEDAEEETSEK